ncbi:MAG: hypothetical protein J7K88_01175 [Candidatus Fermentibacteraceae bacterium]|nr:hypothetical protein [Candidatus Fermentibacteraceae bacterium]
MRIGTYITDITHFLNETGEMPADLPKPAASLASFLVRIIEATTLTQLEADENIKDLSTSKMRLLQGFRGMEQLNNPNIDKTIALKEAEQKLTAATKDLGEAPTLQEIGLLASLAKCLHQQNKPDESREIFQKAETLLQNHINSIENNHYKEAILNSPIIEIFEELKNLLQRKPHQ